MHPLMPKVEHLERGDSKIDSFLLCIRKAAGPGGFFGQIRVTQ